METNTIFFAFGLTLLAGLATGIGSALAFFTRTTNTRFLSLALGFSAGVMIYVSFVEILSKAKVELTAALGHGPGTWVTVGAFFGGIALIALIDWLVPNYENPHELHSIEEMEQKIENLPRNTSHDFGKLRRMGMFTALAIGIHNFPSPSPSPSTTFPRGLPFPSPSILPPAAGGRHSNTLSFRGWPNPSAPWWACSSCCRFSRPPFSVFCLRVLPGSWCSFPLTIAGMAVMAVSLLLFL